MSLKKYFSAISIVLLELVSTAAVAETLVFQFKGSVTYGSPMTVLPGSEITGTFSYDQNTSPSVTYKGFSNYQLPAAFTISATVGGHNIVSDGVQVNVWNHYKGNVEDMVSISGSPMVLDGTTFPNGAFGIHLASKPRQNNALNSTQLPGSYDLKNFNADPGLTYGYLQTDGSQTGTLLHFTIDSIILIKTIP